MQKRRKLLEVFAVGGTACVLQTWQKPTVRSVILPVHAQASCSSTLLEPITVSCSGPNPSPGDAFLLSIDDENDCPSLIMTSVDPDAIPLEGHILTTLDGNFYSLRLFIDGNTVASASSNGMSCGDGNPPILTGFPIIIGLNGTQGVYQSTLSVDIAADNSSVTMTASDFMLVDS